MSENRLYEASARGDERSLEQLLEQEPLLLDRVSYSCSNKTPLHIATIQGHLALVRVILKHNPDLAQELDSQQTSPLHVACSKGYLEIAKELLSAAPDMCLSRDCQGKNPLHLAAMKGHVEVLEELVRVYRMAAQMKLDQGVTVLHLCVAYRQTETLRMLVQNFNEMVNAKNENGQNVLHMAVRDRKIETVNFLLSVTSLEVNGLNLNGITALDILIRSRMYARDSEIEESHKRAYFIYLHWILWHSTKGFTASLSIILLLMSGLPLRRRYFMWFLMVITWIAITAIALTYMRSVIFFVPKPPNLEYATTGYIYLDLSYGTPRHCQYDLFDGEVG